MPHGRFTICSAPLFTWDTSITIGLPTRDVVPTDGYGRLRTRLYKGGIKGERRSVSFEDLLHVGSDEKTRPRFNWLWRSRLKDYDRHARIFEKWLYRMLFFFRRLRHTIDEAKVDAFAMYDELDAMNSDDEILTKVRARIKNKQPGWESMGSFVRSVQFLITELKQASPWSEPPRQ
jgi:hypothetical protein